MKPNFYPKTKLVLSSLKKFFAITLVLILSLGYAKSQGPATALAFSGASPLDLTGLTGASVSIPASPSINVSSAITIEAWIFPTKSSGVQDVLCKSSSTVNNGYIFPRTTNGWRNLQFLLNINGYGWQTLEVPYGLAKLNQWHHLSATYDGYYMKIYIDGVLAGTKDFAGTFTVNNNPLTIGGHPGFSEFFTGKVDEVRLWNRALAGCEINNNISCELPTGQNGLAAYYKLNQGLVNLPNPLVNTVTDESGNNNTGTLNGFLLTGLLSNWATGGGISGTCAVFAPVTATATATQTIIPIGSNIELFATGGDTYSWSGPNGYTSTLQNPIRTGVGLNASGTYTVTVTKNGCSATASVNITVALLGGGLNFDGQSNVVVVPNRASLNPVNGFTIETWIKPTSANPTVQNVISKSTRTSSTGYIFPRTDDGWRSFSFWLDVNGDWKVLSAQFPNLNEWNHVAATYDGFFMKIYLNGNLVGTQVVSGNVIFSNNDLTIGQQDGAPEFYKGSVDETRIWGRPLTQCEIQNNRNCALNGDNNGLASQSSLIAYYRYNQGLVNVNNAAYTTLADSSGNGNNGTLQGFALTGTSSNWIEGHVIATCSPFVGTQASAGSNGPNIEVGSTLNLTASAGTSWSWTGPNSFTSTLQNPSISNAGINRTGTYTVTITGNGCTSTASTNVTVAFKAGTLNFDGINDNIVVPNSPSLNITKTITLESWIYPTNNTTQVQDVMGKSTQDNNNGYIFPRTDDGWNRFVFYLHINGEYQKLSAAYPGINQWHHVAATYDGYYMRIYLDGLLVGSREMSGDITSNNNDLILGSQPGYGEFFAGEVDESRIWSRALNQCEIINNMNCELDPAQKNALVAYYKYNQGFVGANNSAENILTDASDNANNGTLNSFALNGAASNWSTFKVSGTCALFSLPPVTAVANAAIFGVGSTIQLFANGGTSYTWDGPNGFVSTGARPTIPNAQESASGTYTVTAPFVNCVVTASTRLVVSPLDAVVASGPTTFCPSSSVDLSISNPGTYQWYRNDVLIQGATNNTYTASQTGSYTVSVTNSFGDITVSSPINLLVVDNLAPEPDQPVLPTLTLRTPLATVTTIPTATDNCKGVIQGTTNSPLVYNTPGTYTITWAYNDQNGQVVYQDQQVIIELGEDVTPPVLTVPASITTNALITTNCGAIVNFTATATDDFDEPVLISYSQNPGTVFPVGITIVTVTAVDGAENTTTSSFTVTVLPTEVSAINGNTTICAGATTTLSSATANGVWSSDNTSVATVNASGVVTGIAGGTATILYTNACGVFASATITVKASPNAPGITVTDNCGSSVLTASGITGNLVWNTGATTASITVPAGTYTATQTVDGCVSGIATATAAPKAIPATPAITVSNNCGSTILTATNITGSILWSTGATTASITVSAGTYTATQTADGCVSGIATATAAPKVIPATPAITVSNNCGSTILTATNITGSILWSTGATTASITVPAGTYTATQTVDGCVSGIATATAAPKAIPATPAITVSNNCGSTILTATNITGSILWSTGATTASITVPAGTYTATQTVDGCVSGIATATAAPKAIPSTPAITVSNNCGSTTLTASNITGNILWSTGATTTSITVSAGTYTATQTVDGCVSGVATVTAAPKAIPAAPLVVVTNVCGSSTLSTTATGTLLWSNGATTASTTVSVSGNYTVTATIAGCSATSAVTPVTVIPQAVVANIAGPSTVAQGSSIQLTNTTNGGVWASNSSNATVSASGLVSGIAIGSATISYTVTTGSNCSATATYVVTVQPNCVPPVFTTTPSNTTVNAPVGQCTAVVTYTATASGTPTPTYTYTFSGATNATGNGTGTGSTFALGTTNVVIRATNSCGSVASNSFSVTVKDVTPPNAITRNITVSLDANGSVTVTPAQVDNGSNDNCGAITLAFATTSTSATTGTICATANENGILELTAPAGAIITAINFASYGTPNGTCGSFTLGSCNATNSKSIVEGYALGRNSFTIPANNSVFTDPCYGTVKRLYVQATYQLNVTSNSGTASSITFGCAKTGTNNVTLQVTDANGNVSNQTAIVTVQDNTAPVITGIANQSFCNIASSYTIPVVSASDNCGVASITYQVSGATSRSGSGVNASGSFNTGTSTITWTATDASGNNKTSSATVTVGGGPVAAITASNANAFCNQLILTGNAVSNATYKWTLGSTTVSNSSMLTLDQTSADGSYLLTITAGGCTSTATYTYSKQNLSSSYTILAYKEVEIGKYNKVISGSVGVMSSWGEAEFESYSSVTGAGSFVKAPRIDLKGYGINVPNKVYGVATVSLPAMQYNTASTYYLSSYTVSSNANVTLSSNYRYLTIRKGASVTLNGNTFGTIKLEQGANVKFNSAVLNIENLLVDDGAKDGYYSYVRFASGTSVRVSTKVSIGSQVIVNPDYHNVTFYMGDQRCDDEKFSVKGADTKVIANIFMPNGKLKVTSSDNDHDDDDDDHGYGYYNNSNSSNNSSCDHRAHNSRDCKHNKHNHKSCDHRGHNSSDCNDDVFMTGLFIAEEVESKGNTVIWSSFACGSNPLPIVSNNKTAVISQTLTSEDKATTSTTEEELKITVMPNPSTTIFTLKFESKYETPVNMRVMDASGRVVDAKSKIGSNSTIQIGANYSSGTYYAEMTQGSTRKVIQLIKVRG